MSDSSHDNGEKLPFWETKSLDEMDAQEWESLCDGCGRCCLNKVEDWDTGEIIWTNLACTLLDMKACNCKDYPNRQAKVPDCLQLTPKSVREITWLPASCAYARVRDDLPLLWWHPLVSGDPNTVHQAGISVRGQVSSEDGVPLEKYEDHVVFWPMEIPKEDDE
ncbi:MAG: YcgN family cysteine cluster protein [Rhizobiales bacterium]|nr:YcgN family cysteine cluster protein [Hyphomicrobiales bacterium]